MNIISMNYVITLDRLFENLFTVVYTALANKNFSVQSYNVGYRFTSIILASLIFIQANLLMHSGHVFEYAEKNRIKSI